MSVPSATLKDTHSTLQPDFYIHTVRKEKKRKETVAVRQGCSCQALTSPSPPTPPPPFPISSPLLENRVIAISYTHAYSRPSSVLCSKEDTLTRSSSSSLLLRLFRLSRLRLLSFPFLASTTHTQCQCHRRVLRLPRSIRLGAASWRRSPHTAMWRMLGGLDQWPTPTLSFVFSPINRAYPPSSLSRSLVHTWPHSQFLQLCG
jgi:hypothetical protein